MTTISAAPLWEWLWEHVPFSSVGDVKVVGGEYHSIFANATAIRHNIAWKNVMRFIAQ